MASLLLGRAGIYYYEELLNLVYMVARGGDSAPVFQTPPPNIF